MWGISFPINLFTILIAIMAPLFLLALIAQEPIVGVLIVGAVIAVVAARRAARRREAEAIDHQMQRNAEIQAEAISRRIREDGR